MRTCIDVLMVGYNTVDLISPLSKALNASIDIECMRCLFVDNASIDGTLAEFKRCFPNAVTIENTVNVGFGRANNQLVELIESDFVLLLNTDALVSPDTLKATMEYMSEHPDCGVLGVRLVGQDGALQPSCRYFPTPTNVFLAQTGLNRFMPWVRMVDDMTWDHATVRDCDWVPGCYYLVRRKVIEQVGLFDPRYFLYYEEVDHCRRVKQAGWRVVYFPYTSVVHLGGESAKSAGAISEKGRQISSLQVESELLYFRKHFGFLGLAWHMLLVTLGGGILCLKALLKGLGKDVIAKYWRQVAVTWRLLLSTGFATKPTR